MDPVAGLVLAEVAETAVEGAVGAYFVTKATLPLKANLEHVATGKDLARSHHTVVVIGTQAFIFGGQTAAGKLAPHGVTILNISTTDATTASIETAASQATEKDERGPVSRERHTAVAARDRMFVFGGMGPDGKPIEEDGKMWLFDPQNMDWTALDVPPGTAFPGPRYDHACAVSDEQDVLYVHGGRDAEGNVLNDTWQFPLDHGKWTKLATSEGAPRAGSSLAFAQQKLWRFGGVPTDGESEPQDVLQSLRLPLVESFEQARLGLDKQLEIEGWKSIELPPDHEIPSDTKVVDTPTIAPSRNMSALHHISTGQGREYLLIALGEDPTRSANGSRYLADIWAYQLPPAMVSGAGVKDAIRENVPKVESFKGQWAPVDITGLAVGNEESRGGSWTARGAVGSDGTGPRSFLLWGGIDESGDTLGDGWILRVE